VDYETFEYIEKLPGDHVHFFFNTVPQEQAGNPGSGPWILYGGPRPFTKYAKKDRPQDATQMCALVANPDHSVRLNSGNCMLLPDVNVAIPVRDLACLAGPDPVFPASAQLKAGDIIQVLGLAPDEAWWAATDPTLEGQTCWIERKATNFSGDMSTLPLVQTPPLPTGSSNDQFVEITQISLDDQGRYIIQYTARGFTEKLPGTHIHFFYDIFSLEQVGEAGGGNRLMYGGPSPFTDFISADRPAEATRICALVANPDHTVMIDSGNCFAVPDLTQNGDQQRLEVARAWPVGLLEQFNAADNGWPTDFFDNGDSGNITYIFSESKYRVEALGKQPSIWWALPNQENINSFYLAVTTRQVQGPETGEYGLVFRKNDENEYYVYKISNVGKFALFAFHKEAWSRLINWSDTPLVNAGGNNRLEVVGIGSTYELYLNNELLAVYSDTALYGGQLGIFVGVSNPGDAGVWEFDDFEIRSPDLATLSP
jgi:hypothetical protein